MDRLQFLTSLKNLVDYHRICGIEHYPDGGALPGIERCLARLTEDHPTSDAVAAIPAGMPAAPSVPATSADSLDKDLAELSADIAVCRNCDLHQTRVVSTPGNGGSSAVLVIVGEWLAGPTGEGAEGLVFGREQDEMLARMIGAINLSPDQVFITNTVKCSVPVERKPNAAQIATCSAYLAQQIMRINPLLICAMGPVASQTLLDTRLPLSQVRGTLHPCRLVSGSSLSVVVTYHPSFLLQNAEMKKAAWADLQLVQKELSRRVAGRQVNAGP